MTGKRAGGLVAVMALSFASGAQARPLSPGAHAAPRSDQPAGPSTPGSPGQILDHAAQSLGSLHHDLADDSVLLGIPTLEQRRRTERTARDVLARLQEAQVALAAAIKQSEDRLIGKQAETLTAEQTAGIEATLAHLVDFEQSQRLPMLRGLAQALLAGSVEGQPRAEADSILAQLENRAGAPPELLRSAAWERLVVLGARAADPQSDRGATEAELAALIRFVERFPDDPRIVAVAERAEARFNAMRGRAGGEAATSARTPGIERVADLLLEKAPTPERARASLPRRVRALSETPSPERVAEVMRVYRLTSAPAESAETAQVRAALVAAIRARYKESAASPESLRDALSLGRAAHAALRELGEPIGPEAEQAVAELLALSGERTDLDQAASICRAADPGSEWAPFVLAHIQCKTDGAAAAIQTLRNFAESRQPPGSGEPYWRAWAEILELYSSQNTDHARDADIRAQIKRLELLDPNLGTPATAARIKAIRDRVK